MNGGSLPLRAGIYGRDNMCTIVSFMGASINSKGLKSLTSVATPSHLQPTHLKVLAKLANLLDYERSYSRVPNKQTARLLENGKKSHLYALIWNYKFIDFWQKVPPIRLFQPILLLIFSKKSPLYVYSHLSFYYFCPIILPF